ncbi:MAG: hypothetical protein Q8N47_10800, partial [Bryobacterales bacterium]|nr:hypothetical protein [Bryobacterales bacterium]
MTRVLAIAGIPLWAISLWAQQQTIVSTRVSTMPSGAQYYVDGKAYFSPQVFLWPAGSKHVLSVEPPVQTGVRFGERHTFSGWTDSTGRLTAAGPTISITAHPEIASFTASITVDYQVTVRVVDCPVSENWRCDSPGTALVGGTIFDRDGSMYVAPNTVLTLAAFPKPGYVFAGWQHGAGSSDAFL